MLIMNYTTRELRFLPAQSPEMKSTCRLRMSICKVPQLPRYASFEVPTTFTETIIKCFSTAEVGCLARATVIGTVVANNRTGG